MLSPRFPVAALCVLLSMTTWMSSRVEGFSAMPSTMHSRSMKSGTRLWVKREPIRMPSQTPMVPYKAPGSDYTQFVDINSAMYRDRTLMISKFIDENYANEIIGIILFMRRENPRAPISIYLNCPGALLRPALAVYDLLLQTRENCEIDTVNLGLCSGMASLLCSAGTKGQRRAMPNSRFLLQRIGLEGTFRGQATDIALEVKNVKKWNERMENELSLLTGQPVDKIQQDLKRDFYLSSDEAVQYGLIDEVMLPAQRKRAARGQAADLGAFEGEEEQRYQNQPEAQQGGWGSQQQTQRPPNKKDDDDGPEILKG
ncbi:protease proteolytic subunit [Seminavis robusta]|uniref:ATP-dependent Clp protease proteolytic subunit n=1 Tax=Seminavis robusta TaxID=568900 RepID=A0A9N8HNZ3_9STRA|nr:protease proteolytic subunit [Seminavis robusta]|eukprot:Sro1130_g244460.1 protease proteolytic subunit (314) ;mRNA; f:7242-8291